MEDAESQLRYTVLAVCTAVLCHGRADMGRINATRYDKAQGNDQRALIQDEVQESVNEERAGSRA